LIIGSSFPSFHYSNIPFFQRYGVEFWKSSLVQIVIGSMLFVKRDGDATAVPFSTLNSNQNFQSKRF